MFWELLVFGSWLFWSTGFIAVLLILAAIEYERPGRAFGVIAAFFGLCYFFGDIAQWSLFSTIANAPWYTVPLWVIGYFLAGTIWFFFKWYLFLTDRYEKDLAAGVSPEDMDVPQVWQYKNKLLTWACYWPFSVVWTVLGDLVKRIFQIILRKVQHLLQSMSNSVFKEAYQAEQLKKAQELERKAHIKQAMEASLAKTRDKK
jgi:hypothetical protein